MRATVNDIAREASVSVATVDRVLNNRSGVRQRTREIVLEAAQRVGYIAEASDGPVPSRKREPNDLIRLDFVLPAGANNFIETLRHQIQIQAQARPGLDVRIEAIEGFNPDSLARALLDLRDQTQGVGVIALDHPTVREAIRSLSAAGAKVVTIASDIHYVPRVAYVGIDNRAAGRLAGHLLGRLIGAQKAGKIALFAGSLSYRGHEEREMGFRHILAEEFPMLQIVELREVRDDSERAYAEASALLDRHPDLAGIYNIGAGNMGIARALKERRRAQSVVCIAHDSVSSEKGLLLDGTLDALIDQNPRVEAREALNILTHAIKGLPYEEHPPRLNVIFKENIPEI